MKNKFKNKDGSNTLYAFACGYIETKTIDDNNRAILELEGTFHVKGFKNGVHFWEVFERNELTKARKFYKDCLK